MASITSLSALDRLTSELPEIGVTMPVIFVGHGSPMNGIEHNPYSHTWQEVVKSFPQPKAVICISAHWLTRGTYITAMDKPKTIHDFGGFPQALYEVQYPAPGAPALAKETVALVKKTAVGLDHDWGLDHGSWTVIRHMYPQAQIPVLQLSIDYAKPAQYHYELAKDLQSLRKKGVLIMGSGNMVHNLRMVAWDKLAVKGYGYDWAIEMNTLFKKHIADRNHQALIDYEKLGAGAKLAIPTPDHYYPLIYTLGLTTGNDQINYFNDECTGGSLTMTSVMFYQ